ncbi:MAG: mucoidy inhibitor MuiA family protein [Spirochaetales bacterium]|nr:mucoidy inhibitor MuiA family protein [Spirochaetales bacterium]
MPSRKTVALLALFVALAASLAAEGSLDLASRVARVVMYPDRAMVTRRAEFELPKGETTLVFAGLPAALDPASAQVSGSGAFTLRDVRLALKAQVRDVSARRIELEDEKRGFEAKLAVVDDRVREAEEERRFLAGLVARLTSTSGSAEAEALPTDPAQWGKLLDFQRARNAAIDASLRDSRAEAAALKAELDRVARELRALGAPVGPATYEASLVVSAPAAARVRIDFSYLVSGPSWRPDYVIRADSNGSRLSVQYRAFVRQATGESWDGVELQLSTARPRVGGSLPELSPWYVDVYEPVALTRGFAAEAPKAAPSMARESSAAMEELDEFAALPPMALQTAGAVSGAISVTFAIAGATSVAADNAERLVTVALLDLAAEYSWAATPALSPFAYFRAEAVNASDFPFLPGASHVYVDGSYVAEASMPSVSPGGTFRTELGVDESITVGRKLVRKFDETTGALSKRSKTTWEYELRVANGKKREVTLVLSERAPVSLDERIVVKLLAPAYSKDTDALRKLDGEIYEWTLRLAPGAESKIPFSFSVDYPKGETVTGLE